MLTKPNKPPLHTTSYRPISLLIVIMKLSKRVIEKHLPKHLENNGFFSKYQSGLSKSKSSFPSLSDHHAEEHACKIPPLSNQHECSKISKNCARTPGIPKNKYTFNLRTFMSVFCNILLFESKILVKSVIRMYLGLK